MNSAGMVISLAFGLGMVHALDADHIMAVSSLASGGNKARRAWQYAKCWALGHGLSLSLIGACVYLLGSAIPMELSIIAEHLVGVVLILMGLYAILGLRRQRLHIHFHRHDGLPAHAHLHAHPAGSNATAHGHVHRATLLGMLHGTAGSAPLLVLIPIASLGSPWLALLYLLVFSLGVLLAMSLFGGLLGWGIGQCLRRGPVGLKVMQGGVALGTVWAGLVVLNHAG